MYKVYSLATGQLVATYDDEQELADFLRLDLGDVLWAIEEHCELSTDDYRVDVVD